MPSADAGFALFSAATAAAVASEEAKKKQQRQLAIAPSSQASQLQWLEAQFAKPESCASATPRTVHVEFRIAVCGKDSLAASLMFRTADEPVSKEPLAVAVAVEARPKAATEVKDARPKVAPKVKEAWAATEGAAEASEEAAPLLVTKASRKKSVSWCAAPLAVMRIPSALLPTPAYLLEEPARSRVFILAGA